MGSNPAFPIRDRRRFLVALAAVVIIVAGVSLVWWFTGGGGPAERRSPEATESGELDPGRTYLAVPRGAIEVHSEPTTDAPGPPAPAPAPFEDSGVPDGFVVSTPYGAEPGWHEVYLPTGGRAWVEETDVNLVELNVVAVGRGTEVDPRGGGGGSVPVFDAPEAQEPTAEVVNPTTSTGTKVGPVALLVHGPYDPTAEWLEVDLPLRPNGSTAFVSRDDVDVTVNRVRIEVSLDDHRLRVVEGGREVFDEPVGIGTADTPTPGGVFYIRSLIASTSPAYGTYAFGLSGFSDVLQAFNGGPGDIGIHGTNRPETVGRDVSNGCIRLEDPAVIRLAELLPEAQGPQVRDPQMTTGLGVPVDVVA